LCARNVASSSCFWDGEITTDLQNILQGSFQGHSGRKTGSFILPPPIHDIHNGFDQKSIKLLQPKNKVCVRQYWMRGKNLLARVSSWPWGSSIQLLKRSISVPVLVFGGYHGHRLVSVAGGRPAYLLMPGSWLDAAHISD
jgi:hypothetical protein